ncbi:MAG: hypothetical protein NWP83_03025 [Spirosomaceae bacterium]|nr:hypothetical protein [Spirosomataceae bacterium]
MKDKIIFGITAIAISAALLALGGKREKPAPTEQTYSPYVKR